MPSRVRADITYLRQDFSVLQPVRKPVLRSPVEQRFDYLVRLTPMDNTQLARWHENRKAARPAPPQQEALLFALRELTGEDHGPTADDWRRVYSTVTGRRLEKPLGPGDRVRYLADCLTAAEPARQAELLRAYRDRAGTDYDRAVALALPRLTADLHALGRNVLADRLHCLPLKGLQERLADESPDLRRAAVTATWRRKEKALLPDLIARLDDEGEDVAKQAHLALKDLTSRDFGPRRGADRNERRAALAAWRDWWDQEQERRRAKVKVAGP